VEQTLVKFSLISRFRAVVTGDDVAQGKPDPSLFLMAARGLQIAPERLLVCEDAVAGVVAAKTAGMKCLAIAANGRVPLLKDAGADLVVENFEQTDLNDVRRLFT
jgi:beta-phosphoglucomutase-like phosphatase (HAD superfamily)